MSYELICVPNQDNFSVYRLSYYTERQIVSEDAGKISGLINDSMKVMGMDMHRGCKEFNFKMNL